MAACGGAPPANAPEPTPAPATSTSAAASAGPEAPAAVTVVALKYTPPTKAGITPATVEVAADGAITGNGKPLGKVTSTGVDDPTGKAAITVGADGTVAIAGSDGKETLKFSPSDELLSKMEGGTWQHFLSVADDGTASLGPEAGRTAGGKFDGMSPRARREAILVVLALFASKAPPAPPSTIRHDR